MFLVIYKHNVGTSLLENDAGVYLQNNYLHIKLHYINAYASMLFNNVNGRFMVHRVWYRHHSYHTAWVGSQPFWMEYHIFLCWLDIYRKTGLPLNTNQSLGWTVNQTGFVLMVECSIYDQLSFFLFQMLRANFIDNKTRSIINVYDKITVLPKRNVCMHPMSKLWALISSAKHSDVKTVTLVQNKCNNHKNCQICVNIPMSELKPAGTLPQLKKAVHKKFRYVTAFTMRRNGNF